MKNWLTKNWLSIGVVIILITTLWVLSFLYQPLNKFFNAKIVFGFSFFLVGLLILYLRFQWLRFKRNDEFRDLMKELAYLGQNTLTGVLIGIGFASLLVAAGALIYQSEKTNLFHEKIFEILTLYFGTITSFLVIKTIFEKVAPITNVETLLLRVCDDIDDLIKKGKGDVLIVYPALIIGYYRERTNRVLENHYENYSKAIHSIADNLSITATIVTYDTKYYEPLFDEYVKMNIDNYSDDNSEKKAGKDSEVKDCLKEAIRRFNDFKDASNRNCRAFGIEPIDLKEHFIIIGDVVYTITSFGLPISQKDTNGNVIFKKPDFIDDNEKLAKLYAYRQQDKELADLIKKKIEKSLPKV